MWPFTTESEHEILYQQIINLREEIGRKTCYEMESIVLLWDLTKYPHHLDPFKNVGHSLLKAVHSKEPGAPVALSPIYRPVIAIRCLLGV